LGFLARYRDSMRCGMINKQAVGITSDTAEFAVESIRRWRDAMGRDLGPQEASRRGMRSSIPRRTARGRHHDEAI